MPNTNREPVSAYDTLNRMYEQWSSAIHRYERNNNGAPYYLAADFPIPALPEPAEVFACTSCNGMFLRDSFGTVAGVRRPECRTCYRARREAARLLATRGRKFGIELEFEISQTRRDTYGYEYEEPMDAQEVVNALRAGGLNIRDYEGYGHSVIDQWKIVGDSSVECGWELVSPPMFLDEARDQIRTATRVLSELGAEPSAQCGLHVHHEVRDFSLDQIKQLVRDWASVQTVTDTLVDEHRTGYCQWCEPYEDATIAQVEQTRNAHELEYNVSRYHSLNVSCLPRYGTVEVRQHEATLDAEKIIAWVEYGQAVIGASITGNVESMCCTTPREAVDCLPLPDQSKSMLRTLAMANAGRSPRTRHTRNYW